MRLLPFAVALGLAACSHGGGEARIAAHAAGRLGVPAATLRVTPRTDLSTGRTSFYLVSSDDGARLTVVTQGDAIFDDRDPGAFERVSKGENAVRRLSQLGSERVALWFAALGQGVCSYPAGDQAHFAHTHEIPGGVRLSYGFGSTAAPRVCTIELHDDGSLAGARAEDNPAARAQAAGWASDKPEND